MESIYKIRRENLIRILKQSFKRKDGGRKRAAELIGIKPSHLSQVISNVTTKNIGEGLARSIEAGLGLRPFELDKEHIEKTQEDLINEILTNIKELSAIHPDKDLDAIATIVRSVIQDKYKI